MTLIKAAALEVGETLHRNDWHMRIDAVDVVGAAVAVHVTAGFLLHYQADDVVDIDESLPLERALPGVVVPPPAPAQPTVGAL